MTRWGVDHKQSPHFSLPPQLRDAGMRSRRRKRRTEEGAVGGTSITVSPDKRAKRRQESGKLSRRFSQTHLLV